MLLELANFSRQIAACLDDEWTHEDIDEVYATLRHEAARDDRGLHEQKLCSWLRQGSYSHGMRAGRALAI